MPERIDARTPLERLQSERIAEQEAQLRRLTGDLSPLLAVARYQARQAAFCEARQAVQRVRLAQAQTDREKRLLTNAERAITALVAE